MLTGDDLKNLGLPAGPRYRKLLAELLDAKLDGLVRNREEESRVREKEKRTGVKAHLP